MHLCYIDEAGDDAVYHRCHPDQPPVFALLGLAVPLQRQKQLIWDFLQLKKQFLPALGRGTLSELVKHEYKGSTLRSELRSPARKQNRRAVGFVDKCLGILESQGAQIFGEVVIKCEGQPQSQDLYPKAVARLARSFESLLAAADSRGVMVLDSRTKVKNTGNVHHITTRQFKSGGADFPHLAESPVFGHSDTHVALQLVDVVVSAVVLPIACWHYCQDYIENVNVHANYAQLRERFGARLQGLEYRYTDGAGDRLGGLRMTDRLGSKPVHLMFRGDAKYEKPKPVEARRALRPEDDAVPESQSPLPLRAPDSA